MFMRWMIVFLLLFCVSCSAENVVEDLFCGSSTYATCSSESDCVVAGCSAQVCQGVLEESLATTCEYQSCYDAEVYDLSCTCFEEMCQWN